MMERITGSLSAMRVVTGTLSGQSAISAELTVPEVVEPAHYMGPYEVTPTQEEQTIPAAGMMLTRDIVVNPIPNNYGLITWNGAVITVS